MTEYWRQLVLKYSLFFRACTALLQRPLFGNASRSSLFTLSETAVASNPVLQTPCLDEISTRNYGEDKPRTNRTLK